MILNGYRDSVVFWKHRKSYRVSTLLLWILDSSMLSIRSTFNRRKTSRFFSWGSTIALNHISCDTNTHIFMMSLQFAVLQNCVWHDVVVLRLQIKIKRLRPNLRLFLMERNHFNMFLCRQFKWNAMQKQTVKLFISGNWTVCFVCIVYSWCYADRILACIGLIIEYNFERWRRN